MILRWLVVHLAAIAGVLLAAVVISRMIRQRRTPSSTLAWLLGIVLLPYLTVPLYLAVGGRKMRRLAQSKKYLDLPGRGSPPDAAAAPIDRLLQTYGIPAARCGNHLELCRNGEEGYARLVQLIEDATASIFITTFILKADAVGTDIVARLTRRAAQGVAVRIVLDGVGSLQTPGRFFAALIAAGGRVKIFTPVLHRPFHGQTNLRNHRKIVIADGRRVLSGGANIADEYIGATAQPQRWRDLSFVLEGPAVETYLHLFRMDWEFAGGQPLPAPASPSHQDAPAPGAAMLQVVPSGPDVEGDALYGAIISAIHAAERRLWIVTPYFVPDDALTEALLLAVRRGVQVRILLPKVSNHAFTDLARGTYLRDIQAAGGTILLYTTGMMHAKVLLVDESLAVMGSANMDIRNLFLNYEVALCVYSAPEIRATDTWIRGLAEHTESGLEKVGYWRDLGECFARLTAPLL